MAMNFRDGNVSKHFEQRLITKAMEVTVIPAYLRNAANILVSLEKHKDRGCRARCRGA